MRLFETFRAPHSSAPALFASVQGIFGVHSEERLATGGEVARGGGVARSMGGIKVWEVTFSEFIQACWLRWVEVVCKRLGSCVWDFVRMLFGVFHMSTQVLHIVEQEQDIGRY